MKENIYINTSETNDDGILFVVAFDSALWKEFKDEKYYFDFNNGDFLSEDIEHINDFFVPVNTISEDDREEVYSYDKMDIRAECENPAFSDYVVVVFSDMIL